MENFGVQLAGWIAEAHGELRLAIDQVHLLLANAEGVPADVQPHFRTAAASRRRCRRQRDDCETYRDGDSEGDVASGFALHGASRGVTVGYGVGPKID